MLEDIPIPLGAAVGGAAALGLVAWRFMRWLDGRFSALMASIGVEAEKRLELERDLAAQKLFAANNYATKGSVTGALDRFVEEIHGLRLEMKQGLKELGDRMQRTEESWFEHLRNKPD